jgi:putative ABC transport system permease protein
MHPLDTLSSIRRDLTHALRSLSKERGFSLVCIVSLGIGIGAFVALLTFGRAITSPARLINTAGLTELLVLPQGPLRAKAGEWAIEQWSYPDFQALREANTGMDLTGWTRDEVEFGTPVPDQKEQLPRVTALYVTSNYFRTFGVTLSRGPGFDQATHDSPSADPTVIVSHDFWKSRAASDPELVGKPLMVDGVPHTVVGITPEDFRGHFHFFQAPGSMLFLPFERYPRLKADPNLRDDRAADWVRIHGRLHDGVDIKQANALVSTAVARLAELYPASNQFKGATVETYESMGAAGRPEFRRVFSVMLSLGGTVLLIVCMNISGMMLVRGAKRVRELSIRAALGADRRRLIQHLFFESVLLAFVAGGISAGVLFGIPALAGWYLGAPVPQEVDFDATSAALAAGICLLVSVLFGLLPALRFSNPDLAPALKEDSGGGGRQTIRVHRVAAMVQIGIAIPFLVMSGVMLDRTRTAEFGIPMNGLAGARVPSSISTAREAGFSVRSALDGLRKTSGVESVAVAEGMPIDFDYRIFRAAPKGSTEFVSSHVTRIGENFLETIGAKLLRGRTISAEDRLTDARVAVISEPLARLLFPDAEAIGQTVVTTLEDSKEVEYTVVGISADFATSQLTTERPQIMLPLPESLTPTVHLIVRGAPGDEPKLRAALESALRELGVEPLPGVAFPGIVTGQDLLDKSLGDLVSESTAVAVAGGLVLILAALGIVGVVGFMVATRTRELAVRMALGSTRWKVFRLMLVDTVKLVIPGVIGGLVIAAILIRSMDNVMGTPLSVGPKPLGVMEPIIYLIAAGIAVSVALLAGLPAARRATSIQPMAAIRSE